MQKTIYFNPKPATMQTLKTMFKDLCKKHHPDVGGTHEAMKAINAEYELLIEHIKNGFNEEQQNNSEKFHAQSDGFREALMPVINLPNVTVEICGIFIWVTPKDKDMLLHKLTLTEAGYMPCTAKKKWAWHPANYVYTNKRKWKMDKIYNRYGRKTIDTETSTTLPMHKKMLATG